MRANHLIWTSCGLHFLFADLYESTGELLGQGSQGAVQCYRCKKSGKEYAVKVRDSSWFIVELSFCWKSSQSFCHTMIYVIKFTVSAIHASNHLPCLDICQSWVGSKAIKSCDSTLFTCLNIGQSWQNSHNAWQYSKIILCLMKVYGCKKVILANFVVIFMQSSRHPSCCINSWPGAN